MTSTSKTLVETIKAPKFKGEAKHYRRWKQEMKVILQCKKLDAFLKAKQAKSSGDDVEKDKVERDENEAFLILYQACDGDAKDLIADYDVEKGPKAIWDALAEAYGNASMVQAMEAKERLHEMNLYTHKTRSVACYYEAFRAEIAIAQLEIDSLEVKRLFLKGLMVEETGKFDVLCTLAADMEELLDYSLADLKSKAIVAEKAYQEREAVRKNTNGVEVMSANAQVKKGQTFQGKASAGVGTKEGRSTHQVK